ncbi:MAG TPA: site-specific DNA-methyltransferase [Chloroflexota bacterium]|nr:site-specific DNA-methyltransferase [Chloroflexota bacterium]
MESLTLFDTAEAQRTPATLDQLERVIEGGLQTFVEVGLALLAIRDRGLYRKRKGGQYDTFEDYCRERWKFTRQYAYNLMDAAKVAGILSTAVDKPPTAEWQARPLAPLLRTQPEAIPEAWEEAQAIAAEEDRPLAAADVKTVVERRQPKPHVEVWAERREQHIQAAASLAQQERPEDLYDRIWQEHALSFLARLALTDQRVHLCITSPPYWAKRTYGGGSDELGQERTPEEYLARLRQIIGAISRLLVPGGWLLLNLGDTYASQPGQYRGDPSRVRGISDKAAAANATATADREWDVPDKSLCLIPWRLLTSLVMEDGWICRNVVAWSKRGHQPENVGDRWTQAWEPVLALTRTQTPFFDRTDGKADVWDLAVGRQGDGGDHPAVFPDDLVRRAIAQTCPPEGVVLDPFAGSGTVLRVAQTMGRRFLGCDLITDWAKGTA